VPRKKGQVLAIRRAYEETGLNPRDIQYIEAHATATPVGDTVEFEALKEAFGGTGISPNSIEVGSVKALVGHTGWVAGAASVVKMTEALKAKIIPPQSNFTEPNPSFGIEQTPFRISTVAKHWQENAGGAPRRVGVNGFGFGGSNAHLILEEYVPEYHKPRYQQAQKAGITTEGVLSVVGLGSLFPFIPGTRKEEKPQLYFDQADLKLPKNFVVLPDVADDMDKGQIMACIVLSEALRGLGDKWKSWRSSIGVILGVDGKTGYGISANKRIYVDFLERRLKELFSISKPANAEYDRIRSELLGSLRGIRPSGPYTLPGLMPNVTAGRGGNFLDLNGPNFVIDAGNSSLYEAICIADAQLSAGRAKMVLAGVINGYAGPEFQQSSPSPAGIENYRPVAEAGMVLALVSRDFAREQKLPVLAELTLVVAKDGSEQANRIRTGENSGYNLRGAEGALEIADAVQSVKGGKSVELVWPSSSGIYDRILRVSPPGMDSESIQEKAASFPQAAGDKINPSNPIYFCTPRLTPVEGDRNGKRLQMLRGRLLILADQAFWQVNPGSRAVFDDLHPTVLCPVGHVVTNAVPVDLSSEEAIADSLSDLDFTKYDGIIAIKDLSNAPALEAILADGGSGGGLLDLMFAVVRQAYERMKTGEMAFGFLCLNAINGELVHPYSGLLAGFTKAIARELPLAKCKAISVDTGDMRLALNDMETEWGAGPLPASAEVIYKNSVRHEYILDKLDALSSAGEQTLSSDSVVIATGGGRGVTAVLVEHLLLTYHCRVILLGRTNPSSIPSHILSMSQEEFDAQETIYYQEEMKRSPASRIGDLKKRYEYFRNAREVQQTLSTLEALQGKVEYVPADITDSAAIDGMMRTVAGKYGRVDLIIHGAGLQVSKNSARKKMGEFRRIVATKIEGLGNLHRSFHKHFPGAKTHFHLITSVFSYFGNDGQPDYGAANEAMNHIADWMGASGDADEWTSLAWLGWAGIGMTRGSEYEALARARPASRHKRGGTGNLF
jgi:NAD(P)-dependent dehydrogenase (short-subunit alcohol dehydrogenase family)